ncbi:MAG: hypothetical protein ACI8Y4_003387 [Candidatus Poriferisodalaceae bacterium]|jgi:hypothetical protein
MESLFDLPAHVFLVQVPVVAAPLGALATCVVLARSSWLAQYGLWPLGISVVAFAATLLAYASGEEFAVHVEGIVDISRHQSLASTMRIFAGLHVVAVGALVWHGRRERKTDGPRSDQSRSGIV